MGRVDRSNGFTLIELIIVVAIVSVLAVLAVGNAVNSQPRYRILARLRDLRFELLDARAAAVRKNKLRKVCFFADNSSTDRTPKGKIYNFECGTAGDACENGRICTGGNADNPTITANTYVTGACTDATKWCLLETIDYGAGDLDDEHISINRFVKSDGTVDALQTWLEVTYSSSGFISTGRTTNGYTTASVELTNYDQCLPGLQGSTFTCTSFVSRPRVAYLAGGSVRVVE